MTTNVIYPIAHSAQRIIGTALNSTNLHHLGVLARERVVWSSRGPSGGAEILCLIYADDPILGYWYGHVLQHPRNEDKFVSLIVWSNLLIDANNHHLVLKRFHYWIKGRLRYTPCLIQNSNDAYSEAENLLEASIKLASMITRFEVKKRNPLFLTENSDQVLFEDRILQVYGMKDISDMNGVYPLPPEIST